MLLVHSFTLFICVTNIKGYANNDSILSKISDLTKSWHPVSLGLYSLISVPKGEVRHHLNTTAIFPASSIN